MAQAVGVNGGLSTLQHPTPHHHPNNNQNRTCAWPFGAQAVGVNGVLSTLQRSSTAAAMEAGPGYVYSLGALPPSGPSMAAGGGRC